MVKTLKSARQMHLYFTEIPQIQGDFPWPPGIVANDSEVVTRLLVTACWKDKPSLKKSMSGNLPSGTSAGKRLEWNRTEFEITWGHGFIFIGLYCMRWCPIRSCAVPQSSSGKAEVSLPRLSRFVWLRIPDRLHLLQSSRLSKRCGTLSLELNVIGSEFVSWRVISAAGEIFRILDDKIICRWVFCALNVLRLHFRTQKTSPNLTILKNIVLYKVICIKFLYKVEPKSFHPMREGTQNTKLYTSLSDLKSTGISRKTLKFC